MENNKKTKLDDINRIEKNCNEKSRPCVVVTGRNYCNILTMTRALGEAGYDVEVLRVYKKKAKWYQFLAKMKPDAYSRYVKGFYECTVNEQPERILDYLKKLSDGKDKKLLLPVDDYMVAFVDSNLDILNKKYLVPGIAGQKGQIVRFMDKNEQKERAKEKNLPLLKSTLIQSKEGFFEIPKDIVYPCFIKPNVSMNSTKSRMKRCENEAELYDTLKGYARKEDFDILVEEFADIRNEYSILGVSTAEKTIAPCMFRVLEGGNKERKGVSISGEIVAVEKYQAIVDHCVEFIRSLNYTGIFDVDLIETVDGKMYFIELNYRAGASTQAFTSLGVNLAAIFADYMMKGIVPRQTYHVLNEGQTFLSEKVLLEEYARSDADWAKIKRYRQESDIFFIEDEQDPAPYRHFKKFYYVAMLMRIPYRVRDMLKK